MTVPAQNEHWLRVVANLRVDRKNSNIAPHKPLLLLVLAELAEQGKLGEPILLLTGELVFRFMAFWTVVAERRPQRPEITLPFYHLHSDGCWEPLDEAGKPTLDRRRTVAVKLDKGLLACLNDAHFREQMRRVLIARYFVDIGERSLHCTYWSACLCHRVMSLEKTRACMQQGVRGVEKRVSDSP